MSDDSVKPSEASQAVAATKPVRNVIRSRIRAAPNVAVSSGLARNRRLSGHFTDEKTPQSSEASNESDKKATPTGRSPSVSLSRSPSAPKSPGPIDFNENNMRETLLNTQFNRESSVISKPKSPGYDLTKPRTPLSSLNSPVIHDEFINPNNNNNNSPLNIVQSNQSISTLSFRQFINYQANVLQQQSTVSLAPLSPSVAYDQPPTPNKMPSTPGGTEYNPMFSNEHIMNIIKHKSLQKLKKIEAESLKKKRKSYQKSLNDGDGSRSVESGKSGLSTSELTGSVPIDRSKTRMRDLLYYNSKTKKTDSTEALVESVLSPSGSQSSANTTSSLSDPPQSPCPSEISINNELTREQERKKQQVLNSAPQLKFADDGSIIINESSLIIEREEEAPVYSSTVVESEQIDNLTYISYRKFHHTKKWTERETAKFYKALSMIGTDFTMIQRLFSHRSRDEIKRKFKREEKLNQALIDKIMSTTSEIDLSIFVSASSDDERKDSETKKATKKRSPKEKTSTNDNNNNNNNNNLTKRATNKLKRVQKRSFIESESDENSNSAVDAQAKRIKDGNEGRVAESLRNLEIDQSKKMLISPSVEKANNEEEDEEEEELVLDLDNNTISSQNAVINVSYTATEQPTRESSTILDLDSNKIINNNSDTLNVNYQDSSLEANENNKVNQQSRSKIVITPIKKD